MYQTRLTSRPRSVEAIIFSREESPPAKTRFMGASPYSLGSAKPWPVVFLRAFLALAGNTFAIEGRAELLQMVGIIGDGNIFAEQRFVHAFEQTRALVGYGGGG